MDRPIMSSPLPAMDPPADKRDLVIKVKHGDTLRRIGACVYGQFMDQNMSKLRAKIISLFKFNPDADFILTYTDEDGDVVTLVDDDELRDAVIGQYLNPLRINVHLKSDTSSSTEERSEAASQTAAKSHQSGTEPLNIHSIVDETLKSVPEPFRNAISDLSGEVLKVATSAPAFVQLVESFSKLGLPNVSQSLHGKTGESSGETSGISPHLVDLNVEPKRSTVPTQEANTTVSVSPAQKQNECNKMVQEAETAAPAASGRKKDIPQTTYPFDDLLATIWTSNEHLMSEKEGRDARHNGNSASTVVPTSHCGAPMQSIPIHGDSNTEPLPGNTFVPHATQNGVFSRAEGPWNMLAGALSANVPPIPTGNWSSPMLLHSHRRSHSFHDNAARTFHKGVQCDGCGMHPIVGLRFKSKVKDDYDLCNFCFSQMGNEADFMRIDRPVHRTPRLSRGFHSLNSKYRLHLPHASHGCAGRSKVKLESRFIQDVTVLDGTVMPPLTRFTKIWRMRNNGTVAWPFGTQLVWVGGDQFGDQNYTDLQIPPIGFPVEGELEIAVDFTAPAKPGRYVSYWRMATQSGQKFGQRVWVLIQVDYSMPNTPAIDDLPGVINLNLPPESQGQAGIAIPDTNVEPFDSGFRVENIGQQLFKPVVDIPSGSAERTAQPVGDLLDANNDGLLQAPPAAAVPRTISYPLIDLPSVVSPLTEPSADDGNQVEYTLLKELEEMGFEQIDLNKEILRLNEYDLEKSVDDLCGFAEWDPLLAELEEMGFSDKVLNKKLLIKNGGSIKRAVLDLVAGEKLA